MRTKQIIYTSFLKRLIDLVAAVFGLIVLSPVFVLITVILFFQNNGKPFFFQIRPGKKEKLFRIIKFKTMTDKRDEQNNLLSDEKRLTTFGKVLRKTSLDEIPQLLNVLLGQMSLIGPRPLLPEYIPIYSKQELRRHDIKPGITGWAQVNGRNAILWKKKLELDVWYVDNYNFLLDVRIIFLTIKKVVKSDGISSSTHVTIEKFNGKN